MRLRAINRDYLDADLSRHGVWQTHRDALALALQARSYFASAPVQAKESNTPHQIAIYASETMRITCRIMHVVAWTLAHKAAEAGEIPYSSLRGRNYRLGDSEICLHSNATSLAMLPDGVKELSSRSLSLYERAQRLEQMILDDRVCRIPTPRHWAEQLRIKNQQ